MSSNPLPRRLLSPGAGATSIYETIREHEEAHDGRDRSIEPGESIDERNLEEGFHDQDLEALLAEAAESQVTTESTAFLAQQQSQTSPETRGRPPRWLQESRRGGRGHNKEDDVPQSLLLGGRRAHSAKKSGYRSDRTEPRALPAPVPGPSNKNTRIQWDTTRAQQQLYDEPDVRPRRDITASITASGNFLASAEEKAMWRWMNVENLDNFLAEVYSYYVQKGIWSITLAKLLRLMQMAFIVAIGVFLRYCVDYSLVPVSKSLREIVIPQGTKSMSWLPFLLLGAFIAHWILTLVNTALDLRRLGQLQDFYRYLLGISDEEIQTISWQEVVGRLMTLRDSNPRTALKVSARVQRFVGDNSKDRMDAHDIANRIMRKDNYLIALFNKDVLNMSLHIPFLGNRQLYSRNLEWNINSAVLGFFFNDKGQVYQYFLKDTDRKRLIETLRRRFIFYGFMNLIYAPFQITFSLTAYFFRYFKEFQSNPSQLGSRAYTPMAEWKFREFNELYHFFRRRADMSFPFASRYLDQFPKDKTVQISGFIAFVSGALLALLAVASLLDPSNFLNFEISSERTVLFYLGVLTVIWTVSKGIVPEENEVFDPEFAIQEVINYTHYCPSHWKGKLHSDDVRKEFSSLYQMRILIFLEEMMSFCTTPFVLWFILPKRSDRIVDFFREFTVHVDGLGYVCSFALFEFKKAEGADMASKAPVQPTAEDGGLREDYYASKDNKMLASYYSFIDNYGANPRRGPQRPARQRFHPPPTFPGLATQASMTTKSQKRTPTRGSSEIAQSSQGIQMEPSPSLLLDPHHQPVSRHFQQGPSARSRQHPLQEEHTAFMEEEDNIARSLPKPISATMTLEEDSKLGDSWKVTRAAEMEQSDEKDSGPGDDKAGVLGMLYQFQRAQTGR